MSKKKKLKDLIRHMWVHSGYPSNGYLQMDTPRKKLYAKVIGVDWKEHLDAVIKFTNESR